jgi:hypothetical protein
MGGVEAGQTTGAGIHLSIQSIAASPGSEPIRCLFCLGVRFVVGIVQGKSLLALSTCGRRGGWSERFRLFEEVVDGLALGDGMEK